jgi:RNA polymerase sigma factor (sigma-70 family)
MAPLLARRPPADRAFERLYRRHVADVYRYVHAVLRNADDAEDVTQITFMNAYRAFERGERPDAPKNWLIAIAHNVCRQRFRQQQRRPQEAPLFEDAAEMAVEEPEHEFTAGDIQRALGQLAFNQRAALVMRELEGRSYAEIAEIMGLSVGAVETLIFRGRRALREQLEGTLTCAQAELALSKQTDRVLSRQERGQLRAHLRECKECASLARRQRATSGALKALGAIPLPSSLASFFGGGGSTVAVGVAAKAAAVVCAGAVVGTAGYEGVKHVHASPVAAPHRADSSAAGRAQAGAAAPQLGARAPATAESSRAAANARHGTKIVRNNTKSSVVGRGHATPARGRHDKHGEAKSHGSARRSEHGAKAKAAAAHDHGAARRAEHARAVAQRESPPRRAKPTAGALSAGPRVAHRHSRPTAGALSPAPPAAKERPTPKPKRRDERHEPAPSTAPKTQPPAASVPTTAAPEAPFERPPHAAAEPAQKVHK